MQRLNIKTLFQLWQIKHYAKRTADGGAPFMVHVNVLCVCLASVLFANFTNL